MFSTVEHLEFYGVRLLSEALYVFCGNQIEVFYCSLKPLAAFKALKIFKIPPVTDKFLNGT